jgi:hypothetical protein
MKRIESLKMQKFLKQKQLPQIKINIKKFNELKKKITGT